MCERLSESGNKLDFDCADADERRILRLMKEVNIINSHVPESSALRVAMRNKIRALIIDKGL